MSERGEFQSHIPVNSMLDLPVVVFSTYNTKDNKSIEFGTGITT